MYFLLLGQLSVDISVTHCIVWACLILDTWLGDFKITKRFIWNLVFMPFILCSFHCVWQAKVGKIKLQNTSVWCMAISLDQSNYRCWTYDWRIAGTSGRSFVVEMRKIPHRWLLVTLIHRWLLFRDIREKVCWHVHVKPNRINIHVAWGCIRGNLTFSKPLGKLREGEKLMFTLLLRALLHCISITNCTLSSTSAMSIRGGDSKGCSIPGFENASDTA